MRISRKPPKPPPAITSVLEDVASVLREKGHNGIAGDIESASEAIETMLTLTQFGDCLYGDELRNILGIQHQIRSRRGTPEDEAHFNRQKRAESNRA